MLIAFITLITAACIWLAMAYARRKADRTLSQYANDVDNAVTGTLEDMNLPAAFGAPEAAGAAQASSVPTTTTYVLD